MKKFNCPPQPPLGHPLPQGGEGVNSKVVQGVRAMLTKFDAIEEWHDTRKSAPDKVQNCEDG